VALHSWQIGSELCMVGAFAVAFMAVQLLHELAPVLPFSACYAIVGFPLLCAGAILMHRGRRKVQSVSLLPEQPLAPWSTSTKTAL
jgi:hypothetical protein